jgi:hypothetical protein
MEEVSDPYQLGTVMLSGELVVYSLEKSIAYFNQHNAKFIQVVPVIDFPTL